eukprot:scaffold45252_cov44-Prasinocladus_malaysianus.AAC.1
MARRSGCCFPRSEERSNYRRDRSRRLLTSWKTDGTGSRMTPPGEELHSRRLQSTGPLELTPALPPGWSYGPLGPAATMPPRSAALLSYEYWYGRDAC